MLRAVISISCHVIFSLLGQQKNKTKKAWWEKLRVYFLMVFAIARHIIWTRHFHRIFCIWSRLDSRRVYLYGVAARGQNKVDGWCIIIMRGEMRVEERKNMERLQVAGVEDLLLVNSSLGQGLVVVQVSTETTEVLNTSDLEGSRLDVEVGKGLDASQFVVNHHALDLIGAESLPWEEVHGLGQQTGNGLGDVEVTDIQVGGLLDVVQQILVGVLLITIGD